MEMPSTTPFLLKGTLTSTSKVIAYTLARKVKIRSKIAPIILLKPIGEFP